jgi:hypothetical protein
MLQELPCLGEFLGVSAFSKSVFLTNNNWLSRCLSIAPASQVQEHLRPSSDLTPRLRSRVRWDDFSGLDAVDVRGETQGKRGWTCDASRSQPEGSDR